MIGPPQVMTAEQAADYPAAPDSGAVELDAMEELTPGRLGRIVRDHIEVFRDLDLPEKVEDTRTEAEEALHTAVDDAIADDLDAVEEIKAEAEVIYGSYRERLAALAAELDTELPPLDERLRNVQQSRSRKYRGVGARLARPTRAGDARGRRRFRGLALRVGPRVPGATRTLQAR